MTGRDFVALRFSDPDAWERAVRAALRKAKGNRTRAAEALGVSLRTFMRWLAGERFSDVAPGVPGSHGKP